MTSNYNYMACVSEPIHMTTKNKSINKLKIYNINNQKTHLEQIMFYQDLPVININSRAQKNKTLANTSYIKK